MHCDISTQNYKKLVINNYWEDLTVVSYVNNVHDERYKCVNRECQRTDLEPDAVNMENVDL